MSRWRPTRLPVYPSTDNRRRTSMTTVVADISVSLDGFVTGPDAWNLESLG